MGNMIHGGKRRRGRQVSTKKICNNRKRRHSSTGYQTPAQRYAEPMGIQKMAA
jgi:hypothetical protein